MEWSMAWLMLLGMGIFHGINPGMGWLFAVGLGLQEQRRSAVWAALLPLALGHALAVGVAILVFGLIGSMIPAAVLKWGVAAVLLGFGVYKLFRSRHPRYGGMQVGARELTVWSFLMATAHGAGLMVLPFVFGVASMSAGPDAAAHEQGTAAANGHGAVAVHGHGAVSAHGHSAVSAHDHGAVSAHDHSVATAYEHGAADLRDHSLASAHGHGAAGEQKQSAATLHKQGAFDARDLGAAETHAHGSAAAHDRATMNHIAYARATDQGTGDATAGHAGHAEAMAMLPNDPIVGLLATLVHTIGYLLIMGIAAVVVYEKLGLRMLQRAWVNLDVIWAAALILTAICTPFV